MVPPSWDEVQSDCVRHLPEATCSLLRKEFEIRERREYHQLVHRQLSKGVTQYMNQLPADHIPQNVDQALVKVQQWVDAQTPPSSVVGEVNSRMLTAITDATTPTLPTNGAINAMSTLIQHGVACVIDHTESNMVFLV